MLIEIRKACLFIIGLLLFTYVFFNAATAHLNMPPRDYCNAPAGMIDQCKASEDCQLNPRELRLWTEHQNMLKELCPDS